MAVTSRCLETAALVSWFGCRSRELLNGRSICSKKLLARLRYKDLIASGPRSPRPGPPHTFVTPDAFLATFDLQSLRDLPELELYQRDHG
ncbi:hypothetical protein GTA62_19095 [Roseobacter sp. HKCCD9010]|uniref:SMC-Scp complex subunit ScpB n=1 Tax=unclassified Roseobacter TaxID=196798 RepID=UPI001491F94B|nr:MULTISPECIES: SMC-Scp complex subunit ScpB [unclassified Roseobacter]MBF9052138.1 hypothetical protein [Rhodobacterales bacterium HKCCD4356]NNV14058.1 hypothetical protein [Roseobacter sp. HKCCD7357]NNV18268.1 hypothetical protein [Roseobacter sp. HKCCD8768]NNV27757.1 hypothetical protein [Roseobacter sp. HKCCD8192]NNV32032.1 hypothetical protein [Roseobacter sp. HKCCD9061]